MSCSKSGSESPMCLTLETFETARSTKFRLLQI